MSEILEWGGNDFPEGDREMWEEQYMRGRAPELTIAGDATVEPVRAVEIPEMRLEEARERISRLHADEDTLVMPAVADERVGFDVIATGHNWEGFPESEWR